MVTGKSDDRLPFAIAAIASFLRQGYSNKHLLIINTGRSLEPQSPHITEILVNDQRLKLGDLRNAGLEEATKLGAKYVAQWDDDDWSAKDRLEIQTAQCLATPRSACVLRWQLRYSLIKNSAFNFRWSYNSCPGIPGTIVHTLEPDIRYPSKARAEDDDFLKLFAPNIFVVDNSPKQKPGPELYIRMYLGFNTWDENHIMLKAKNMKDDWAVEESQEDELQEFLACLDLR